MLWAVMTALFSILPAVGTAAVWGVGVIYLGITGHLGRAVFLLVYGTGVISVADNVIRSLVLSGRVKLNALLVFFSAAGRGSGFRNHRFVRRTDHRLGCHRAVDNPYRGAGRMGASIRRR